ncbi:MAG: ABC transporter ATP-binding protein [Lachnospiraceae bacterium]|nr:ABC transporter ATP-binding protein [Lachnospiraceae bacterium]
MEMKQAIYGTNIQKKYGNFELDIPDLNIPQGYATALIGENGAGKTTLMNILSGVRLDYHGEVRFFEETDVCGKGEKKDLFARNLFNEAEERLRERIGYTAPSEYFLPTWTVKQVIEASEILFDHFNRERFIDIITKLNIPVDSKVKFGKKISDLSDGNRMKLELACVLARDTDLLLLDEPASPLDPLMRDRLCDIIRDYLDAGDGERSVFFSTHNISDMENVTDYAIVMENGEIIEEGFVEDLKEKYIMVRADAEAIDALKPHMLGAHVSNYGIDGLMKREHIDVAESVDAVIQIPTLSEISVALMKQYTGLKI